MDIVGTTEAGRYATRVRIASPQGSRYDGLEGVVTKVVGQTVYVRLGFYKRDVTLPFGRGELQVLK